MPKIKLNDINLYYEIHGKGQALVLITGFRRDHNEWQNLIPEYAKYYQVIVLDNRGAGQTDCPDYPYTTEMMAEDVVQLLNALQINSAHFIGHSFGGCILQTIAYRHPKFVKSAVIVNSILKASQRLKWVAEIRLALLKANMPNDILAKFAAMTSFSSCFLNQPGIIETMTNILPSKLDGYTQQYHALCNFDSHEWITAIKAPCLIIGANEDWLADVTDSEKMAAAIAHAEYYCFDKVGHVAFAEQPEQFNKIVLSFLNKLSND